MTDNRAPGVFDDQAALGARGEARLAEYLVEQGNHLVFRAVGLDYPMDLILVNRHTGIVTAIDVKVRNYPPDFFERNPPAFRAEHLHNLWHQAFNSDIRQAVVLLLSDGSAWWWEVSDDLGHLDGLPGGPDGLQDVPHLSVPWRCFQQMKRADGDPG